MYEHFEWPIPPAYELPPGEVFTGHEPAMLTLKNGTRLRGSLSRFLATHRLAEFLPARGRANLDIPFDDIRELRLTRPLRLKPRQRAAEGRIELPPARQPFRVELACGEVLEGETAGFEQITAGLFLYIVNYGETVLRVFLPASSIRERRIGKRLGEMLVEARMAAGEAVEAGLAKQRELREQKLGELLAEQRIVTHEELHRALERQRALPIRRLGEALLEMSAVTSAQLEEALERQKQNRKRPLGDILVEMGVLSRRDLLRALSQKLGIPHVDVANYEIAPAALKLLSAELARELRIVPVDREAEALVIAMENPLDAAAIDRVRFATRGAVIPALASAEDIDRAIERLYGSGAGVKIEELATRLSAEVLEAVPDEEAVQESDSTLVRLMNKMILDAHERGVSDIHVETNGGSRNVVVRFRHDGVLHEYLQLPAAFRRAVVARLKIMAGLDIAERRRAQDGRIDFAQFGPARLELRVATFPTLDGLEDVVMRLLSGGEPVPLARLGLAADTLLAVRGLLARPHGLLLACGPTGSGKTTTLHSLLAVLNSPERKILTAEDPVEISQAGIRQVQVNAKIGWTFAAAMRSFLRADPDVIMVGEMRDAETAAIAIEASLTGHLVFSTLHTNSAAETVTRLLEMGMDPYNFGDSLAGVLSQRLGRRLCEHCRSSEPASDDTLEDLAREYLADGAEAADTGALIAAWRERHGAELRLSHAPGCEHCRRVGYKGRIGLYELLVVGPEHAKLIHRRAPAAELKALAVRLGMRTLKQDGIEKCLAGVTDLHEVRAAAG